MNKSQATRAENLFTKQKRLIGHYYHAVDLKEPIAMLERRGGNVEFYENVTTGQFLFQHSDGTNRYIYIIPTRKKRFSFLDKQYMGYWLHEDHPYPLPEEPIQNMAEQERIIESTLTDSKKWETKLQAAKSKTWWYIIMGILGAIALGIIYVMVKPPTPIIQQAAQAAATAANTTAINLSHAGAIIVP